MKVLKKYEINFKKFDLDDYISQLKEWRYSVFIITINNTTYYSVYKRSEKWIHADPKELYYILEPKDYLWILFNKQMSELELTAVYDVINKKYTAKGFVEKFLIKKEVEEITIES